MRFGEVPVSDPSACRAPVLPILVAFGPNRTVLLPMIPSDNSTYPLRQYVQRAFSKIGGTATKFKGMGYPVLDGRSIK